MGQKHPAMVRFMLVTKRNLDPVGHRITSWIYWCDFYRKIVKSPSSSKVEETLFALKVFYWNKPRDSKIPFSLKKKSRLFFSPYRLRWGNCWHCPLHPCFHLCLGLQHPSFTLSLSSSYSPSLTSNLATNSHNLILKIYPDSFSAPLLSVTLNHAPTSF